VEGFDRYLDEGTFKLLMVWIVGDYINGVLTVDSLAYVLQRDSPLSPGSDVIDLLESLGMESLLLNILPVQNADALDTWLFCTQTYPEANRRFIVGKLQIERIRWLRRLGDDCSKDYVDALRRFLDLFPRFCYEVQELFRPSLHEFWRGLGLVLIRLYINSHESSSVRGPESTLSDAMHAVEQALSYHQPIGNVYMQDVNNVTIAQVCFKKISGFSMKCDEGLSYLREAEKCYDEIRQDYTLLGDPKGLEIHSGLSKGSTMPIYIGKL
jgi:hypothetical protein